MKKTAALLLLGLSACKGGEFFVVDGDTLRNGKDRTRIFGIDAPEIGQTCANKDGTAYQCGLAAKHTLQDFIAGKKIECRTVDHDRHGRAVAVCRANGEDIGDYMVRSGNAIAYRRYSLDYVKAENEARENQRGMWRGRFTAPEVHRLENGKGPKGL